MELKQALEVIGKGLEIANARHAFGLADASLIQTAYAIILKNYNDALPKEEPEEKKKEGKK